MKYSTNKINKEHISVKKALEIANTYMYKANIRETKDGKAYIVLNGSTISWSPYPIYMRSVARTKQYVQKMYQKYEDTPF